MRDCVKFVDFLLMTYFWVYCRSLWKAPKYYESPDSHGTHSIMLGVEQGLLIQMSIFTILSVIKLWILGILGMFCFLKNFIFIIIFSTFKEK